jgi:hypothetical protein
VRRRRRGGGGDSLGTGSLTLTGTTFSGEKKEGGRRGQFRDRVTDPDRDNLSR